MSKEKKKPAHAAGGWKGSNPHPAQAIVLVAFIVELVWATYWFLY